MIIKEYYIIVYKTNDDNLIYMDKDGYPRSDIVWAEKHNTQSIAEYELAQYDFPEDYEILKVVATYNIQNIK